MQKKILYVVVMVLTLACSTPKEQKNNAVIGLWKMELNLTQEDKTIPFFLEIINENDLLKAAVWNGVERIVHDDIYLSGDSLFIESPYFNSTLYLKHDQNTLVGIWQDHSRTDYTIPVSGKYNLSERFRFNGPLTTDVDGKWEVTFSPNTDHQYKAIGLFETDDHSMKGTFLTETGDYRFLDGGYGGNELKLSTFDGSHAFLFEAEQINDTLRGWFWSGKHWKEQFIAWRNDSATLADPYSLTTLTNPEKPIEIAFKNLEGKIVTLEDEQFKGKPVLLQIMGSWCPNCMDETAFLAAQQDWLSENGVEILALSFERLPYEEAIQPLQKLKTNLDVNYPILYAGKASKKEALKAVPWLTEIISYPTLIYVLPNRTVYRIHTGFFGPGTDRYFEKQSSDMFNDIKTLIEMSKESNP